VLVREALLSNRQSLARVPTTGGPHREIAKDILDADWGPDGASLAVARWKARRGERASLWRIVSRRDRNRRSEGQVREGADLAWMPDEKELVTQIMAPDHMSGRFVIYNIASGAVRPMQKDRVGRIAGS